MFSGVQERLQERLGPLKTWLFPRRVYLQLEDQAITALALEGQRVLWLERILVPSGLIEQGEAVRVDSLGDLLGDLFVDRGFAGARVDVVLPPGASQIRAVRWPDGRWPSPDRTDAILQSHQESLGLSVALQYLDLHRVDLPLDPPTSLLIGVPSATLDQWIDVFTLAALSLDRVEASHPCVCRALPGILEVQTLRGLHAVLKLEPQRSRLLLLEDGVPLYERRLPGAEDPAAVQAETERCLAFWRQWRPAPSAAAQLLLHGSALESEDLAAAVAEGLGCTWQVLDPLAGGGLEGLPAAVEAPRGTALVPLWGLARAGVMA